VLGLQQKPTVVEAAAWLVYAVPMVMYVGWPRRRPRKPARTAQQVPATATA
jgi:high-affinity iron transporter